MAAVLRRDATVFYNPPRTQLRDGKILKCFSKLHFIDEKDGALFTIEEWWTPEEIRIHQPSVQPHLLPPEPGDVYYVGPVWPNNPRRMKKALEAFLATLPIPTNVVSIRP